MILRPNIRPARRRSLRRARFPLGFVVAIAAGLLSILLFQMLSGQTAASQPRTGALADYRGRVHDVMIALDSLAAPNAETDAEERASVSLSTIDDVRRLLPASEEVEWGGGAGSLSVDNRWLHALLDEYAQALEEGDSERAAATLTRTTERLHALSERLGEIDEARASRRDKDAERDRLAAILRRPEYNQSKPKNESALARLAQRIAKWIRELMPEMRPLRPGMSSTSTTAAQVFIYLLSLAVIILVLWKFGPRLWRRGREGKTRLRGEPRTVLGVTLRPDQTPADLLQEAERLARAGDVRGAIRKAYVSLLCELGDRKIIHLAQHKTNRDYLQALRREGSQLYGEMQPLTSNFERHWYGYETATDADWTDFRKRCRQVLEA